MLISVMSCFQIMYIQLYTYNANLANLHHLNSEVQELTLLYQVCLLGLLYSDVRHTTIAVD